MSTKRSFDLNGLSLEIFRIDESLSAQNNGLFIKPTPNIPNRNISGYILSSINEYGKVEWTDPSYLPNVSQKQSVRVASTLNEDLNNPVLIIDGINLNQDDRVLIKNQVDLTENGIYTVDSSNYLLRSYDAELGTISTGAFTFVTQGITNAATVWVSTEYDSVFGNPITFTEVGSGGGGVPGGNNTELQYNNAGIFGGISGVITNGSQLQLLDNVSLLIGTSSDFEIVFDTTDLSFINNNITSNTIFQLGSDTINTQFNVQNNSGDVIFTGYGNQETTLGSNLTVQGTITNESIETNINTAANVIYTATQLIGGIIIRDPNGSSRNDTTDTAVNIISLIHDPIIGTSFEFTIFNTGTVGENITILPGTNVTLDPSGVFVIDPTESRTFKVVFTNVTPASEALTIYSISSNGQGVTTSAGGNPTEVQYNNAGVLGGITGVTTNGSTQFDFGDNVTLRFGSSQELQIVYDTTNSIIQSTSGDLIFDNTNVTGSTIHRLGTSDSATTYEIQNDSNDIITNVQGNGFTQHYVITNPVVTGTLVSGSLTGIRPVSIQNDTLFFGTTGGVLGSVNVSLKSSPVFISSISPGTAFEYIKARAKYCYATGGNTVSIFDISDPSNISLVDSITDATDLLSSQGFDISGDHVYVGINGGLTSIDIADPTIITINSSLTDAAFNGQVVNVVVYGKYAYCISSSNAFNIIDISNPSTMTIIGTLTDAINLPSNIGLVVRGNYVYVGSSDRITILNAEDKTTPVVDNTIIDAAFSTVNSIVLSGDYLYAISNVDETIVTVDILTLTIIGSLSVGTFTNGFSLSIQGNYLYTSSQDDNVLHVIQLNGNKLPSTEIGNLNVQGDTNITNNVNIQGYMNCQSGAQFNNALAVMSNMTVHDDFVSKGLFYTQSLYCYNREPVSVNIITNNEVYIDTYNFVGTIECNDIVTNEFDLIVSNEHCHLGSNVFVNSIGLNDIRIGVLEINEQQFKLRIKCNNESISEKIQYFIIS